MSGEFAGNASGPKDGKRPYGRRDVPSLFFAMDCWSVLIGARKLRAKGRRFSRADDRRIQEITTRHFPKGFTILEALGGWYDPKQRRFIKEESRQISIVAATPAIVRRWGQELGRALKQHEIVVIHHGRALRVCVRTPRS